MDAPTKPAAAQGDLRGEAEDLFADWQEQEEHVDLSDLSWVDIVVFVLFWGLFAVVFLQFFTRYVLNDSLGWTEEIARYLLIGVTFFGAVFAMRKGTHIAVEAGLVFLPVRARHWLLVTIDLTVTGFCAAMAYHAGQLAQRAPGYMVSIDIPKSVLYWGVAISFAGMAINALVRFINRLRGKEGDALHQLTLD